MVSILHAAALALCAVLSMPQKDIPRSVIETPMPIHHNKLSISFQIPRSIWKMLDGMSCAYLLGDFVDTCVKLLLLDFFLASIYLQAMEIITMEP